MRRTQTVGILVPGLTWPCLLLNTMNRGADSLTQFARPACPS